MELHLIITLIRRWAWLLILGAIVGVGAGFLYSNYQEPVYETTTKVLVMGNPTQDISNINNFDAYEMVDTFIELLQAKPVLERTSELLGYEIHAGQIKAKAIDYTRLMVITVQDGDPQRAAAIANQLVDVLIHYNDSLQTDRFAASEESLQAQINQVESQINQVQANITQGNSGENANLTQQLVEQETELAQNIAAAQAEIIQIEAELSRLETDPTTFLAPTEQARLQAKQAELAERRFTLDLEQNSYNSRLSLGSQRNEETEQSLLAIQAQISDLENEIKALKNPVELDGRLRTLRTQLAGLQFALTLDEQRYQQLLSAMENGSGQSSNQLNQDQSTLNLYQGIYSELLNTYESVRLARLQNTPNIVHVEEASAPHTPIQPRPLTNMMLGAAVGLIVMGGIAFLIEYLDNTIKTPDDVGRALQLPVIGFVTTVDKLSKNGSSQIYVAEEPRSPVAEAFRGLRTNLEYAGVDKPLKTILVTSAGAGEGKTTVASNLAVVMAQRYKNVLLLECDLRRPRIHRVTSLANRTGLVDLFVYQTAIDDIAQSAGVKGLSVISSGSLPPNPAELLGSEKMNQLLTAFTDQYDMVIIDSPPLIVSDAAVLAARVDGVLLVLEPGRTEIGAASASVEQLRRVNANVLGVVFNRMPKKRPGYYTGYSYYYDQYYQPYGYKEDGRLETKQKQGHSRHGRFARLSTFLGRSKPESFDQQPEAGKS
ncbi:MAG: polysaccharide biosynthesis tyrosine autokinase [Anaerolineales bacterium]|nr:polysaccharide biosynthesis tyrosine autokinase [Anaerolineales bacterium]